MPVLPLLAFGLLWWLVAVHRPKLGLTTLSRRGALLVAFLFFETLVDLITDLTSWGHRFTRLAVATSWAVIVILMLALACPEIRRFVRRWPGGSELMSRTRARLQSLGAFDGLMVALMVLAFVVLAVIGWWYPPSNGDSLVYHLTRVAHWIQDHSVAHFATHYTPQVEFAPLAEFNVAHLHLLSGTDRLDGYVQLLAALVCVVGISELARLLGANRSVQIMASVLCVAIPSGLLEATSTQNNYFAAAIGLAGLVVLVAWPAGRGWQARAAVIGICTGLAVLSKGTLPAFMAPAMVLLAVLVIRREIKATSVTAALRRLVAAGAVIAVTAVVVAGPFLWRNIEVFGGPGGPVSSTNISSDLTVRAGVANIIRSVAGNFHIGNGSDGLETLVSKAAFDVLRPAYSYTDIDPADSRYLVGTDADAFRVQDYTLVQRDEDFGANPWHILLMGVAVVILLVGLLRRDRRVRTMLVLAVGLSLGFVLFSASARWSVFAQRYQVPLLVAWCAVIALALGRLPRLVGRVIVILMLVASLPQLLDNSTRSFIHPAHNFPTRLAAYFDYTGPRTARYVPDFPSAKAAVARYEDATDAIADSSCKRVGIANWILFEYPIWAGLAQRGWHGTIDHVGVTNETRQLARAGVHPCAWIRQIYAETDVPPDDGTLRLRFGNLLVSLVPAQERAAPTTVKGFSSNDVGVRVLPGSGWSVARTGAQPVVTDTGTLFLYSTRTRTVRLRLHPAAGNGDLVTLVLRGQTLPRATTATSAGTFEFDVTLQRGVTSVRLNVGTGHDASPVRFDRIEVN